MIWRGNLPALNCNRLSLLSQSDLPMDLWTVENSRIVRRKWELGDDPDLLLLPHGPMTEKQARTTRPRKVRHRYTKSSVISSDYSDVSGAGISVYSHANDACNGHCLASAVPHRPTAEEILDEHQNDQKKAEFLRPRCCPSQDLVLFLRLMLDLPGSITPGVAYRSCRPNGAFW